MKYKYAVYCSGSAGRIIKFYNENSLLDYPLEFLIYDGDNDATKEKLNNLIGKKAIFYQNDATLTAKTRNQKFSDNLLKLLIDNSVDYMFCFGDKILKAELVNVYKNKIVNFHPSILPQYPGLKAIDQALEKNEELLGNTAHFIDEGIDTGPIIIQTTIERSKFINYDSVLDLQIKMLSDVWGMFEDGNLKRY